MSGRRSDSFIADNRWIRMADKILWDLFEVKYAGLFPSSTGNVAKPLHMALGSLIIQNRFRYSDRELVEQITENPYLQYFIGLPGYQDTPPFDASTLVLQEESMVSMTKLPKIPKHTKLPKVTCCNCLRTITQSSQSYMTSQQ